MPLFDLPLEELRRYTSSAVLPPDFEAFWDRTIRDARTFPLDTVFEPVENYLAIVARGQGYSGAVGDTADPHRRQVRWRTRAS
ncbi:acetylxylan esterase [Arthrobacter sp. IA7]|nr:acetylxylan esterase [Arthrobacter ipis]